MVGKDIKEVKGILKELKGKKCKLPPKDKYILEWTASELKAYIKAETKGMNILEKLKFAQGLDKKIKDEKAKARLKKDN